MALNIQFQPTHTDREDDKHVGVRIHNESCKLPLPGHKERMMAHCEQVQREYLSKRGKDGRFIEAEAE